MLKLASAPDSVKNPSSFPARLPRRVGWRLMISKPSQPAAFAAHSLFVTAAGAAVLALGAFLFPRQLPPGACLAALGVLAGTSLLAGLWRARRQSSSTAPAVVTATTNREPAGKVGSLFLPDEAAVSDAAILSVEFERWLKSATDFERAQIFLRPLGAEEMTFVPANPSEPAVALAPDSPLRRFFQETTETILTGRSSRNGAGDVAAAARVVCESLGASVCLPLRSEHDLFGLVLLGEPNASAHSQSISVESAILGARQLSLLLSCERLREQLRLARETELLGSISRGLAHDLNNLITPAWTFLQLCQTGEAGPGMNNELLPTALRSMETMRDYVEEALFFSETQQPQLRLRHVDATMQKVIAAAAPALKRAGLQLYTSVEANLTAHYDEVLLRRLLGNLLNNAIAASPTGSRIDIEAVPLIKTNPRQNWLRLRVRDQGSGMTPENVKRVLDRHGPLLNASAEGRGNGLGLAICQRIVQLHHGELQLTSFAGRGTTVEIDLPREKTGLTPAAMISPATTRAGLTHIT